MHGLCSGARDHAADGAPSNSRHELASLFGILTQMSQWVIYWNREVVGRWVAHLIGFWLYGTAASVFLYARGAPNVWTDYIFGWKCIAVFVAACVVGSLCLATLKALLIIARSLRGHSRRLPAAVDIRTIDNDLWLHIPPE